MPMTWTLKWSDSTGSGWHQSGRHRGWALQAAAPWFAIIVRKSGARRQSWNRIEKAVRVSEFTFPGDPMTLDYGYRKNGTRGFVQTLSVSRAPADCKLFAYTADRIAGRFPSEFTAVADVELQPEHNERHRFVRDTLRDAASSLWT